MPTSPKKSGSSNQNSDGKSSRKIQRENNRRFIKHLVARNKILEIMVKGEKGSLAFAWCNNEESIQDIINQLNSDEFNYTDAFMTINKPREEAYANKKLNKLYFTKNRPLKCFKDDDIERINFLFVDVDPVSKERPVSKEVNARCVDVRKRIKEDLVEHGFTDPIEVNSGNGAALFFPLKGYLNTPKTRVLINSTLKYLEEKYSNDIAHVDTKVGNASRYCRVPGTMNYKNVGENDENFRYCKVITSPPEIDPLPSKEFRRIITTFGISTENSNQEDITVVNGKTELCVSALDVEMYLAHHKINISKIKQENGYTLYCLEKCVFNKEHGPNEAAIVQQANGRLQYQ